MANQIRNIVTQSTIVDEQSRVDLKNGLESEKSCMNNGRRIGQRIELCGTPDLIVKNIRIYSLTDTYWFLPVKYDLNQSSVTPPTPQQVNFSNKISWSIRSKALLKSR